MSGVVLWAVVVVRIILHRILYGARSSAMLMIMVRDFSSDPLSVRPPACLVDYGCVCVCACMDWHSADDRLPEWGPCDCVTVCLRVE